MTPQITLNTIPKLSKKQRATTKQVLRLTRNNRIDMYTPLYLKWITDKDLLYSTGNTAHVTAWIEGEFGGEGIPVYVWLGPFIVHLKLSQHC